MWGRVVNYKECQEKCRSAIKRWQIAEAKTAYSSLADRHYPTGALTLHAAGPPDNGKEQAAELSIDEVAPRL